MSRQVAHKYAGNSTDNPYGHRAARVASINNNGRIARTAAARRTQCRVGTRQGQCGASSLQGGNHTFPHSETIRDLPVRRAQGAGVRISKVGKRQVISRPQETRLQNKCVGHRQAAERHLPVGLDIDRELLLAQQQHALVQSPTPLSLSSRRQARLSFQVAIAQPKHRTSK
jgi:hypothetical protein